MFVRIVSRVALVVAAACGSSSGPGSPDELPSDASQSGDDGGEDDREVDAQPAPPDAAAVPQYGGWRMRGRDRRQGRQSPSGGPSKELNGASLFLRIDPVRTISDVVIDEQGNLFLIAGNATISGMAEPIVSSYKPAGPLRWEVVLPAYPHEIALGPLGEVYVIAGDDLAGNRQVVSVTATGELRRR